MVIQRFREAAQSATPALCAPGEVFCNMDLDYVGTLTGLISDMMEGTQLREQFAPGSLVQTTLDFLPHFP